MCVLLFIKVLELWLENSELVDTSKAIVIFNEYLLTNSSTRLLQFSLERVYIAFGYLPSQLRLSVVCLPVCISSTVCNVRAP